MADQSLTDAAAAALRYLALGWSVVPVASGSKRPLVLWHDYQKERPTAGQIREWYRRWPDAGVAIVTGAVSRLAVLDVDVGHGGHESLDELERRHGPLPRTVEARTGGGGRHLYFAWAAGELRNRTGIAPGLDLRAEGGLVVAPPSLHVSGRRYEWESARDPAGTELASMPAWLVRLAGGDAPARGHPTAWWRALVEEGVREGERNSTIASLTGHLLWHGIDPTVALELLLCWNRVRCRPPLDDAEVAQTVDSIARTHARHRGEDGGAGRG